MLNETEAQELHELVGAAAETAGNGELPDAADLARARELAAVVLADVSDDEDDPVECRTMEVTVEEMAAIDTARIELGFSTEQGGANEDNESAEAACATIERFSRRFHAARVRFINRDSVQI